MPKRIQPITLAANEATELKGIINQGSHPVRMIKRAQILLHSHAGKVPQEIAGWLDVCLSTIYNTRQRYLAEGWRQRSTRKLGPGNRLNWTSASKQR